MTNTSGTSNVHRNAHVSQLIRLQQDGKDAINGPAQWKEPPLLDTDTDEDEELNRLIEAMCPSTQDRSKSGRWHWLIGSPGNGKSAKLGSIARRLEKLGYVIKSDKGLTISENEPNWLPYSLEVSEEGAPYRFAYLVQDASIVRNPYGSVCDPAEDLMDVLREATAHGTSLLVCTNWGVLERLFDKGVKDSKIRNEPWFRAVSGAVNRHSATVSIHTSGGHSRGRTVFDKLEVTYELLDKRSLLVNSNIFEKLVLKAIRQEKWDICRSCPSMSICPFKANRDDLATSSLRDNVLAILRRAEVLDGQIVVFREAVAFISLLLAGCPNDHNGRSPCEWVHDQREHDRLFDLLSRRLPAVFFSGKRLHGINTKYDQRDGSNHEKRDQLQAISVICDLSDNDSIVSKALESIMKGDQLSTDLGVERLLGANGAIPALDPLSEPRHIESLDTFLAVATSTDLDDTDHAKDSIVTIRELEKRCIQIWEDIFDLIASQIDPVVGQNLYFWIRRWQTSHLAWIAAITNGLSAYQSELDGFLAFLETSGDQTERLATIVRLNEVLESLLAPDRATDNYGVNVELAGSLWLTGRWAGSELRPQLNQESNVDNNALFVNMSGSHRFLVGAETYIWLSRQQNFNLSSLSFNPDILDSLRRTQAQAAAASQYSIQNRDVALIVTDEQETRYRIERVEGHLLPTEQL